MLSAIIIVQLLFGLTCFSAQPTSESESLLQPSSKNTTKTSLYYDQRQTGKYNINVNIKDVAIISLEPENLSSNIGVSMVLLTFCLNLFIPYSISKSLRNSEN